MIDHEMSMRIQHYIIQKSICCMVVIKISLKHTQIYVIQLVIVKCWIQCLRVHIAIFVQSQRAGVAIKKVLADQQIAWLKQNHEI